ncbi:MAG: hypothetical protein ACH6QR_00520 [Candidatus Carsonella ruddii]
MINIICDYDNTIINCDSDYLWNYFIYKLKIFNLNNQKINFFFYYLYEKKIINNYFYYYYFKLFFDKIKKIKIIFNYIIKIFLNNISYNINKTISSSSNCYIIYNKIKINNNYLFCFINKKINIQYYKIINITNIITFNYYNIFLSDSINDIYFFFYNKKNLILNSDKIIYLTKNIKKVNKNLLFN